MQTNQTNSNISMQTNELKNEITNKPLTHKSCIYIHLNVHKQMTDAK